MPHGNAYRFASHLGPLCALLLPIAVLFPTPGYSQDTQGMCDLAVEPAATLLLPYFEVDLENPDGLTTLLSINNAWAEPALVNLTMWTDQGISFVNFQMHLTGYDVVTVNLRDIFQGNIPITADEASDPTDTISPHGNHPEWDDSFTLCDSFFPFFVNPVINRALLDRMIASHTGQPDPSTGLCSGQRHQDGHARGYITFDNVNQCTLDNPSGANSDPDDPAYFSDGGQGIANNNNQLWGDFYLVDPANNSAIGEPMVHVQAFGDVDSGLWEDGDATFYGRYIGSSAEDNREPLPSVFGVRYLSGGAFSGGTELIAWREADFGEPVECGVEMPGSLPLNQREIYAFNEQEDVEELCFYPGCPICSPPEPSFFYDCLPLASQRVNIDQDDAFQSPGFDAGWLYLDLNQRSPADAARQAWLLSRVSASGRFSVGLPAVALRSTCDGVPDLIDLSTF